jgi:hypothetical protein
MKWKFLVKRLNDKLQKIWWVESLIILDYSKWEKRKWWKMLRDRNTLYPIKTIGYLEIKLVMSHFQEYTIVCILQLYIIIIQILSYITIAIVNSISIITVHPMLIKKLIQETFHQEHKKHITTDLRILALNIQVRVMQT